MVWVCIFPTQFKLWWASFQNTGFECLLIIGPFLWRVSIQVFTNFWIAFFVVVGWQVSSLYILDTNPLSYVWFAGPTQVVFSPHSVGCFFALLMVSFNAQKVFSSYGIKFIFSFVVCSFGIMLVRDILIAYDKSINLNRNCISECKEKFRSRPRSDIVRSTNYSDGISTLSFYIIAPDFSFLF